MRHIVCQVRDSFSYLPEFITYHLDLVDRIWLIDHMSNPPLKFLNSNTINVFTLSTNGQHQSEAVSLVSRTIKNQDPMGWLYVLDIDEFLPFNSYKEASWFEGMYQKDRVIGFNWKNGVCPGHIYNKKNDEYKSISEYPFIIFTPNINPNQKIAINLRKVSSEFSVCTGGHGATDIRWGNRRKLKIVASSRALYHIVAENAEHFFAKINRYIDQFQYRENVRGIGGWMVKNYLSSENTDFYDIIAKFRTSKLDLIYQNSIVHHYDFFAKIRYNDNLKLLKNQITKTLKCKNKDSTVKSITDEEQNFISTKTDEKNVNLNMSWFKLIEDQIVIRQK